MSKTIKLNYLSIFLGIALVTSAVVFLVFPFVSYDSGYYLSMMREMHAGQLYFKEIASPYNPMAIVLMGLSFFFSTTYSFEISLFINLSAIASSSFVLYHIMGLINKNKALNLFLSLSFIALCFIYDGNHLVLEPFSVLFQLMALYFYLKFKTTHNKVLIFITGLCIACSFLSKQYGLFILLPVGLDLLWQQRGKQLFKSILFLTLGVLLPIALMYIYYVSFGIEFIEFLEFILGQGVKLDSGSGTGLNATFKFRHLLNAFLYIPIVFLLPILLFKTKKNKDLFFYSLLVICSLSPFLFGAYDHYYQYIFAYILLLLVHGLTYSSIEVPKTLFLVVLILGVVKISFKLVSEMKHQIEDSNIQQNNKRILKDIIPQKSTVYLSGVSPAFYFLGDYKSINLNRIGFSFPGYFYPKTIVNNLKSGYYLIITDAYLDDYKNYFQLFEIEHYSLVGEDNTTIPIMVLKKR
ncbi:ArnT family glycosyltransferase [Winogradskyella aurantia]|uniref:Glycosyltransferase RgtA/B/C/D-like domain-containing protein n=1 Tax=Winogradskyella aurantia TaxID=1915063 RepID=A0A265UXJ4_9FLAO|nr:hypothetical protein [Winogradskyella aurantia]OZV70035.1 hypothetical protein CA834_05300 [Winogradskyella aurantia]